MQLLVIQFTIKMFHIHHFVLWPTNAQLFHKLSHSYMFRHYRVILRELVISTLPSYASISNAAVGNTCVTWQGIDYKLPEDDTIVSKYVGVWYFVKYTFWVILHLSETAQFEYGGGFLSDPPPRAAPWIDGRGEKSNYESQNRHAVRLQCVYREM